MAKRPAVEGDDSFSNVLASPRTRENLRVPHPSVSTTTTDIRNNNISTIFSSGVTESKASFSPFNMFGSGKTKNILEERKEDDGPIDIATFGIKINENKDKDRTFMKRSCVILLTIAAIGLIVATPTALVLLAEGESNNEVGDGSFCGSLEEDERIRKQIAERFDQRLDNPGLFFFNDQFTSCLPSDMFGELSEEQTLVLSTLTTIEWVFMGLEKISPTAFENENLKQLETLRLSSNGLSNLPEDLLKPLPNLLGLFLDRNGVGEIKPNFFSHVPFLVTLFLSQTSVVEIPSALLNGGRTLQVLDFTGCQSLVNFQPGLLRNFAGLQRVVFTDVNFVFRNKFNEANFRQQSQIISTATVLGLN